MFGILVSGFNTVLGWIFRGATVKFVFLFAIFYIIEALVSALAGLVPGISDLNNAFAGLPSGIWWFLDLFSFSTGAPLVLAAVVSRFLIRRIPFIG